MRHYDEGKVALIDLNLNKLLWQSPKGLFTFPHDAKFTKEGHITLFNNGRASAMRSEIIEMNIKTNQILWRYDGISRKEQESLSTFFHFRMFSPFISGVQKTEKGFLVTVGNQGRVFEISRDKKIVWDLPSAGSFTRTINGGLGKELFKVRQYD